MRPGPRDELVTRAVERALQEVAEELRLIEPLDPVEAPARLSRHVMNELARSLDPATSADEQTAVTNALLDAAAGSEEARVALPARLLTGIKARGPLGAPMDLPPAPATPLSQSDLLVNAEGQPNIGSELRAELASGDRVDLICAFVIWSGVRHLRQQLEDVAKRGRLRVITTTYMGVTEKRAVDELVRLGAEVKVALDARTTKLHAKAWLIERDTGLSTAFVGSSNLSHTALFDGLEWNVRLSSVDAAPVIDRVRMTFESHWNSEHFEAYDPARNGDALEAALREHDRRALGESTTISFANLDVQPYQHQRRMLEALTVERDRHGRHRNLVVAATGTGKTVVAALDYRQLRERHGELSLLFVAHRMEILRQSRATYAAVLRDGSFGEVHGDGRVAGGRHVFAMIQSLGAERVQQLDPGAFDVVVIDEFHHAAAASYYRLLSWLNPRELLGLTATPERLDGRDVTEWFDHRIAVELRLWEAIDQGFLVPFQYFGLADDVDLSSVTWRRGGYVLDELSNLYTGDHVRVAKLIQALQDSLLDIGAMRALGFCVSVKHAQFMAKAFTDAGLPSVALSGEDSTDVRAAALADLGAGRLRCVFSVEVLGEGVDIPNVDTLLLLRPTASATLFAQQLGRGLRRAEGKSHLAVFDLIGQQRREFRFEDKLRAIIDRRRGAVADQVEADFPFLPAGCTIDLDRQSRELILQNLRAAARHSRWATLVSDLRASPAERTLGEFLDEHGHRLEEVYRSKRSWFELRRDAGRTPPATLSAREEIGLRAIGRMTHIDDPERVAFYGSILESDQAPSLQDLDERRRRLLTMLAWSLESGRWDVESLQGFYDALAAAPIVRQELATLLGVLDARSVTTARPGSLPPEIPLTTHARYSRAEIVAALGSGSGVKPKVTQGGILWVDEAQADAFFVDLKKAAKDYSPSTMYRDYAINRELFHWESQARQSTSMPTVRRYIDHEKRGTRILLFVREAKTFELGTQPFTYLGPARYVEHVGERPVAFTWRLETAMPASMFEVARSVAAA